LKENLGDYWDCFFRLKAKDEEWREAKKNFERFWKEQSEKYYLKSLDYMGINCKNSDARIIRNRHLLNEIENIKEDVKEIIFFISINFHRIFF
jgi:paired amphipathic helix protein Sin3a